MAAGRTSTHRLVRMVSAQALVDDPLRSLRAVRIAVELDLTLDAATGEAARPTRPGSRASRSERVFAELKRVVSADAVLAACSCSTSTG